MPLVDDDGELLNISDPWCLQSAQQQERTKSLIDLYRSELEDEIGRFTVSDLWTGRVLIEPQQDLGLQPLVGYLHDASADARLVVDDFVPELLRGTWEGNATSVKPVKPKKLEA